MMKRYVFAGVLLGLLMMSLGGCRERKVASILEYGVARSGMGDWIHPEKQKDLYVTLDRMVENGINTVILGSFYFMPAYFVDFSATDYPEAQQFSVEEVKRNRETLLANIRYARSKGIQNILLCSYSHYLPVKFWQAHQQELNPGGIYDRLLKTAHQSKLYLDALDGNDFRIPHQQWSNPFYKEFFVYSTRLALDALPEVNGFLNCYAESAWTYNEQKLREDQWTAWKDCIDYAATDSCFVDYMNTLYDILKEKRGDQFLLGIRDWYMEMPLLTKSKIPADKILVSIKYGGYDQPVANYPLWGEDMRKLGFSVLYDIHVFGSEHPSPLYWYDNDFIQKLVRNIVNAGYKSIAFQDFICGDNDNPIRHLAQQSIGAAITGRDFTRTDAIHFLQPYYGDAAEDVLLSLECVTASQRDNIRLAPGGFWKGDGLTVGGLLDRSLYMYLDNPGAPKGMAFIREDVVGLPEYAKAMIEGEGVLNEAKLQWQHEERRTPEAAMDDMLYNADKALNAMMRARHKVSGSKEKFDELFASAVIHKQLVLRDIAITRAALAYFASGGQHCGQYQADEASFMTDLDYTQNAKFSGLGIDMPVELEKTGIDMRDEVITNYKEFIRRNIIVQELCSQYMPRRRTLRHPVNYNFAARIVENCGGQLEVPMLPDQEEIAKLSALIEGQEG